MMIGPLRLGGEPVDERDRLEKILEGELLTDRVAVERPAVQRPEALLGLCMRQSHRTSVRLLWLSRAHLVEAHARVLDRLERFLLHLERARPLGRAGERAAGNRPMIRALGALQVLEGGGVLSLPLQPAREARRRRLFAVAGAFDAERIAGVAPLRAGRPAAVAFDGQQTIATIADEDVCHEITVRLKPDTTGIHGPPEAGHYGRRHDRIPVVSGFSRTVTGHQSATG